MWEVGWNDEVWSGKRGESDLNIPPIVRGGTNRNNGVWFARDTMWVQNEDTAHLPDKVDRRTFRELLTADQPPPLSPEQALASMRPRPGFKVELVAAEPLVQDPTVFLDDLNFPTGVMPWRNGVLVSAAPEIFYAADSDGDGKADKRKALFTGFAERQPAASCERL